MSFADVFANIPNDKRVVVKSPTSALAKLIARYTESAKDKDYAPDIQDAWVGSDLKSAMALLPIEDQVKLAYFYCIDTGLLEVEHPVEHEDPETVMEIDRHRAYLWILKSGFMLFAAFVAVTTGATLAYAFRSDSNEGFEGVRVLLSTAAEIAKIFFTGE